jgi:AraC-like DNA-binding protein
MISRKRPCPPRRDAEISRRKTRLLPDGSYVFEDQLAIEGVVTTKIVTCTGWLLEMFKVTAGELFFVCGQSQIRPTTKCFGVFYPPFTIVQPCFKRTKGYVIGIASTKRLDAGITTVPVIFEMLSVELPSGAGEVSGILKAGRNHRAIGVNPHASSLTIRAKRLIDETRASVPSIARIATRLKVSHEHLSRQFRRDFGMSPRQYLHQLRVADAPLFLARGEAIADVSQEIGYGDLSRFYKQFRKRTKTSPGVCRKMVTPSRG